LNLFHFYFLIHVALSPILPKDSEKSKLTPVFLVKNGSMSELNFSNLLQIDDKITEEVVWFKIVHWREEER